MLWNRRPTCAFLAALCMLALAALSAPATSQPSQAQTCEPTDAAYCDLHDAMLAGVDQDVALDNSMKAIETAFRAEPDIQALEQDAPGTIAKIIRAMRPVIKDMNARIQREYRPAFLEIYQKHLSADEARDLADFYRSEVGRKILGAASAGYSPDQTISGALTDQPVTQEQIDADLDNASQAAIEGLDSEDLAAIDQALRDNPTLLKLAPAMREIRQMRLAMEREEPNADEDARMSQAIGQVMRAGL